MIRERFAYLHGEGKNPQLSLIDVQFVHSLLNYMTIVSPSTKLWEILLFMEGNYLQFTGPLI